jgi:hypothetical protein
MVETVETVFGDPANKKSVRKIPDEAFGKLKELIAEFNIEDKAGLKARYVERLNLPAIQKETDPFIGALRATRALYLGEYAGSSGIEALFAPFSVGNKAFQDKKKDTYRIRVFGLIRSTDDKNPLEGPADISVSGFQTETLANQFGAAIQPGNVYKIRANPSKDSPGGVLADGACAFLFAEGNRPFEPVQVDQSDEFWSDPAEKLVQYFPATPVGTLLSGGAKPNTKYRIDADIVAARTGVREEDNTPYGNITLADDSVTKDIAAASKGGLFAYVPRHSVAVATLPIGSRVAAIVDGYQKEKKDKSGALTGDSEWKFNIHAIKVTADLSAGMTTPEPTKTAVSTPDAPAEVVIDL